MQPRPVPFPSCSQRDYLGQEQCSVARTLEIIGDRWTWLIIRDAFLGITRFGEFEESLGVAANVLDDRLSRLVDEGIFERVPTASGRHASSTCSPGRDPTCSPR